MVRKKRDKTLLPTSFFSVKKKTTLEQYPRKLKTLFHQLVEKGFLYLFFVFFGQARGFPFLDNHEGLPLLDDFVDDVFLRLWICHFYKIYSLIHFCKTNVIRCIY